MRWITCCSTGIRRRATATSTARRAASAHRQDSGVRRPAEAAAGDRPVQGAQRAGNAPSLERCAGASRCRSVMRQMVRVDHGWQHVWQLRGGRVLRSTSWPVRDGAQRRLALEGVPIIVSPEMSTAGRWLRVSGNTQGGRCACTGRGGSAIAAASPRRWTAVPTAEVATVLAFGGWTTTSRARCSISHLAVSGY